MAAPPSKPSDLLAWDVEGGLEQARGQVRRRVAERAGAVGEGTDGTVHWLRPGRSAGDLAAIETLGRGVVVGSDHVLWTWSDEELTALAALIRRGQGWLVFVEPTAGLGWRRALQLAGDGWNRRRGISYRMDVPARLRAVGLVVTTQVRFRHGLIGDRVRGEARHFPHFDP